MAILTQVFIFFNIKIITANNIARFRLFGALLYRFLQKYIISLPEWGGFIYGTEFFGTPFFSHI